MLETVRSGRTRCCRSNATITPMLSKQFEDFECWMMLGPVERHLQRRRHLHPMSIRWKVPERMAFRRGPSKKSTITPMATRPSGVSSPCHACRHALYSWQYAGLPSRAAALAASVADTSILTLKNSGGGAESTKFPSRTVICI